MKNKYLTIICTLSLLLNIMNSCFIFYDKKQNDVEFTGGVSIANKSYYLDYLLDNTGNITIPDFFDSYMIYFHSKSCSACLLTNEVIAKYIESGYGNFMPLYFATNESSPLLFDDFNIEVTPTLILFNESENKYYVYEGYEDIYIRLDSIVEEANNEKA